MLTPLTTLQLALVVLQTQEDKIQLFNLALANLYQRVVVVEGAHQQHLPLFQIKMVDQAAVEIIVVPLMVKVDKETEEVFHHLKETVEEMEHTFQVPVEELMAEAEAAEPMKLVRVLLSL
tara:strand:+ start:164 stop:523 length:360 start_codon:yes stop_codon:yes gene_type:complete